MARSKRRTRLGFWQYLEEDASEVPLLGRLTDDVKSAEILACLRPSLLDSESWAEIADALDGLVPRIPRLSRDARFELSESLAAAVASMQPTSLHEHRVLCLSAMLYVLTRQAGTDRALARLVTSVTTLGEEYAYPLLKFIVWLRGSKHKREDCTHYYMLALLLAYSNVLRCTVPATTEQLPEWLSSDDWWRQAWFTVFMGDQGLFNRLERVQEWVVPG